jgi:hypothetical protein
VTSASGADELGCASRVEHDKLTSHSSKALRSSGVQVMGWESLTLGPRERRAVVSGWPSRRSEISYRNSACAEIDGAGWQIGGGGQSCG